MKIKKLMSAFLVGGLLFAGATQAQKISVSGQLGWASPNGSAFEDSFGEKMASGGIGYGADIMYHPDFLDGKLGLGLNYNASVLFGASTSETLELGLYGLSLYGVKGQYNFIPGKYSPYVSLSTGLSALSTPEVTSGDVVLVEGETAYSFGLRPEVGVELGNFKMSAGYIVPFNYKLDGASESISAGALQISIGYRYSLDL